MKEFDVIRLLFIAIPTGMFTTYGIFWVIIFTLKVKKTEEMFRKFMSLYSLFAGITGLLLVVFYFFPDVFACLNILYGVFVVYTMILLYHFFYQVAGLRKRFSMLHYLPPALTGSILLIFSILFSGEWTRYGNDISLFAALIFGIIYSVLPLCEMYKFQLAISIKRGTPTAVDKSKAIPFVCEILLYPTVSIVLPLVGGSHPGIAVSILLMLCCLTALIMNIPLTYALIRHYIGTSFSNTSIFEAAILPVEQPANIIEKQMNPQNDATAKHIYPGLSGNQRKKGRPVALNKKVFENYFRTYKPYLNPKLTIIDLVEPLNSNRTYISKFVNQVYGMNFSSYVNLCRLHEMKRLQSLPLNKGKSEAMLCIKAGFGKYRNYLYVKKQFSILVPLKKEETNG